ncbi:MAG: transposase [Rhodococcus sp. (in: high G+C Gram-positive bacteria)]
MARSYRPVVRDQEFLLPPNMADWLPQDHLVWFIIDVVEQFDTEAFHARSRRGGRGRQGFDPDMLLGLLLYAYATGVRSSRRIERLCGDHVAFRVLCGQDTPDHTTIARFRADNQEAFADLFAQVLRLCATAGMVKVGIVSIDGTKIAANAARGANRSPDHVREQAKRIADDIVAQAVTTDAGEDAAAAAGSGDDEDLPPGFADHSGRAANIKKALEELARQDGQHHEADAADRIRADEFLARTEAGEPIGGVPPAGVDLVRYHQARLDRATRLITSLEGVTGKQASRHRSEARRLLIAATKSLTLAQAKAAAGAIDERGTSQRKRDCLERYARQRGSAGRTVNVTDPDSRLMTEGSGGGSVQGYNAQVAVTDDHFILGVHLSQDANDKHCFIPTLTAASTSAAAIGATIGTALADAGYFTTQNLTADGPERLIAPGKKHTIAEAAKDPTHGPPPPDASPEDAMRHQLRNPENATTYKRRSATVETVIAHLKDQVGLRTFSRRGLPAATSELHLAAAVTNLLKIHASTRPPT